MGIEQASLCSNIEKESSSFLIVTISLLLGVLKYKLIKLIALSLYSCNLNKF